MEASPYQLVLVDTTVYSKARHSSRVRADLERFTEACVPAICVPLALELLHMTHSRQEYRRESSNLDKYVNLESIPEVDATARDLQRRLWEGHLQRAAGTVDILVAAFAIVYRAIVLHDDEDYVHLRSVDSRLMHWRVSGD